MDVLRLTEMCLEAPHCYLVIPKPASFRCGERVRLAGRNGPLGRICNVKENGDQLDVLAAFSSDEILRWLVKIGAVRLAAKQTGANVQPAPAHSTDEVGS